MTHCSSPRAPDLVVLAAGLGRRFGGGKQLAAIGNSGKPLMYFSVMDAWRAGVRKLVLVVDPATANVVEEQFLPLLPPGLSVRLVPQRTQDIPDGCSANPRGKPWGTGHALWCSRDAVPGACIVINADDYYGAGAMTRLVEHFSRRTDWAMVSYPLDGTLSDFGDVNRGLCDIRDGWLVSVRECLDVSRNGEQVSGELAGDRVRLDPETPVSMNIWGFGPEIFECLGRGLAAFFAGLETGSDDEFYLPAQVMASIESGEARVRVYHGREQWLGITYREDLQRLAAAFEASG